MKKKNTLFWHIFRWPIFFLVHPALPFLWLAEFLHIVWDDGLKRAFKSVWPMIKRDFKTIKYAWIFNVTGKDKWAEDAESERKEWLRAKHSNRQKA